MQTNLQLLPPSQRSTRFLTTDLNVVDCRPQFSADGSYIVFMRQAHDGNPASASSLYMIPTDGSSLNAKLLFAGTNATRPDFSWIRQNYQIAFAALGAGIWLLDIETQNIRQVLDSNINGQRYQWSYPAWYPDGEHLLVTNYNSYSSETTAYHQLVKVNVNKLNEFIVVTSNEEVWPGMASVSQVDPLMIAFAGQKPTPQPPEPCTCANGKCDSDGYAQDCNQIWLQKGTGKPTPIDTAQGRAPWFSPDGQLLTFESNRANPKLIDAYRIFLYSILDSTVEALTPASMKVQHAKWSPDGRQIVFSVGLFGGAQGIAVMDVRFNT